MSQHVQRREETRMKILDSAKRLFMQKGFAEVSIDDIMAGAGLTRGGFYTYFESKGALFAAATERMIAQKMHDVGTGIAPREIAVGMLRQYLASEHYEAEDTGCPLVAQTSDRTRTDPSVRNAYEIAFKALIELFERGTDVQPEQRRQRALVLASLCVGSLTLGRAIDNFPLIDELREATQAAAMELGQWAMEPRG